MDEEDMIYMYNHILEYLLLSHNKEWNNAICSNMDEHGDYYTKRSKSENDKYIIYMWNQKYYTNELVYETDSQTEQTCGCLGGGTVGEGWTETWD